jgi:hypothetical protein
MEAWAVAAVGVRAAKTIPKGLLAALVPLLVLGLIFVGYCWYDIARSESVRYLPKWVWMLISIASVPLGGIVYLLLGRER